MHLTLDQITAREAVLRHEITERQRLLAAYRLIRTDRLTYLAAVSAPNIAVPASSSVLPDSVPPAVTPPSSVPLLPRVNPQLQAVSFGHAGTGRAVLWVLRQMTSDFDVHDIAAVLRQEGCPIAVAKLSVVLNRMKIYGQITEISRGHGRTPSVFRAFAPAVARPPEEFEQNEDGRSTTDLTATVQEATPAPGS